MITPAQYAMAMHSSSFAKKTGFDLDVSNGKFVLRPVSGLAAILLKDTSNIHYDNLENAAAFLRGWEVLSRHLAGLASIDAAEVKSRMDQQKVADVLSGKKRKTLKV